jgi:ABC-type lipoprotein export system ATPase subunit
VNAEPSVRLKRLVIEQLFGPGSSTIDIPFKVDGRVTVLHGRNGSGKTITLGLLAALRNGNFAEFVRYPLKRFQLTLTDDSSLVIERIHPESDHPAQKISRRKKPPRQSLRIELRHPDGTVSPLGDISEPDLNDEKSQRRMRDIAPWLRQLGPDLWVDEREGVALSATDVRHRYGIQLPIDVPAWNLAPEKRQELRAFLENLPPVKFIKADRLFVREPERDAREPGRHRGHGLMVERLSQDIRALIVQADREYRQISTRLDSSLANRLFEHHKDIPELSDLKQRSRNLREQTERLRVLGLLQEAPSSLDEERLSDEQKGSFFIILQDREEKLAPFAQVVDKAERLLLSLNRKLAPKSVRFDVEKGYQIRTATGEPLALESLSSGEQHELVLLHELLFDVRPGSVILIDEPELSLHVTWQVDVLPDLLEIAKLSNLDFVLATHSPYITRDHDDLLVRLGEPV